MSKLIKSTALVSAWATIVVVLFASGAIASTVSAIKRPGAFPSVPDGRCTATLKKSAQGGFMQLFIGSDSNTPLSLADDVTAIAWANSTTLVYSVSPVYGKPGVFLTTCVTAPQAKKLVSPTHFDKAYPDGADYFELYSLRGGRALYYYGGDVDTIDLARLHGKKNLRTVEIPLGGTSP